MKRGKGFHIWILCAFALGPAFVNHAASLHWENVGGFAPGAALLRGVKFGGGTFVAWGDNHLVYSQDGVNWRRGQDLAANSEFQSLAYGNGRFAAVGRSGYISVSQDGAHWNTQFISTSAGFSDISRIPINSLSEANGMLVPQNVAFGNGIFVKVDYDVWSGVDPYQMTRPPRLPGPITGLAGDGKVVVAVGTLGHLPYAVTPPILILLSTNNGESFEQITAPAGASGLAGVRYADGKFVAVGISGTIITSPDGRSWTKVQSNTDGDLYDLLYAEGKWRVVGTRGRVLSSTDATSFTVQSLGDGFDLHSIAYGNGAYVVVSPHNGLFRSTTGSEWTPTGTNLFGGPWAVTLGGGKFVTSGFACATSTDGVNWELSEYGGASGLRIAYANGFFASARDFAEVEVSRDGKRWELVQVDANTFFYAVDAVDGRLWTAGSVGAIWRAVANPQLSASINASGSYELNVDVDQPGTFRILTSTTGLPDSWQPVDLLNIATHAKWTNAPSSASIRFFQVRKEYQ